MAVHNRHSSKVNCKVQSQPKRCHCRRHLPPSHHLRHLLLILLQPLQQLRSHGPFHRGLALFFFSTVPLPRMRQMGINSIAYVYLSHLVNLQSSPSLCLRRVPPRSRFGFNVIPSNLGSNLTKFLATCPGCKSSHCTSRAPVSTSAFFSGTVFASMHIMPWTGTFPNFPLPFPQCMHAVQQVTACYSQRTVIFHYDFTARALVNVFVPVCRTVAMRVNPLACAVTGSSVSPYKSLRQNIGVLMKTGLGQI
jgi:hypothetical protein